MLSIPVTAFVTQFSTSGVSLVKTAGFPGHSVRFEATKLATAVWVNLLKEGKVWL